MHGWGWGGWRGQMQHNTYAVGDQLGVKHSGGYSEWMVMMFFLRKQHVDNIEMIDRSIDWSINQSHLLFCYLQKLQVCFFYSHRIQLTHHVWHHGQVAPHHTQLYFQRFYLEDQVMNKGMNEGMNGVWQTTKRKIKTKKCAKISLKRSRKKNLLFPTLFSGL